MYFYERGELKLGIPNFNALEVEALARSVAGPCYIYDLDDIERRSTALGQALEGINHGVHYAMKANANDTILRRLCSLGAGVDTVSGGEIQLAIEAGIHPEKIILSGVGKTVSEIELALRSRIKQINVESPQELKRIAAIAARLKVTANIVLRMNPDVSPKTHPYITTGFRENKFGLGESFLPELIEIFRASPQELKLCGLSIHIGSLLFDTGVMREAIDKTLKVYRNLQSMNFDLDRFDIGGGLGIHYETADDSKDFALISEYGLMVQDAFKDLKREPRFELLIEPGRILVARSGLLVTEVQYVKRTPDKTFVIVDSGMNHLLRPALYGATHRILPLRQLTSAAETVDVVGPICESSDFFAKNIALPRLQEGDLIGIADTGAYGFSMASRYNQHRLPSEVCVSRNRVVMI